MENSSDAGMIYKRVKENGLVMSRVPRDTKEAFVNLAEDQFCDDFGLCFKYCFDQAMEYQRMKNIMFTDMIDKINYIAENTQPIEEEENVAETSSNEKIITLINGKKLNYKGGKDE